MDLPVSSFVCHSSLLTAKSVNLVVAHDGFLSQWKLSVFFIVVTLIAKELFEQLLIFNGLNMDEMRHCRYFSFQTMTGACSTI